MTAPPAVSAPPSPPPVRDAPGLAAPAFRRLWLGETTSAVGSSVSSVALPLIALTTLHASVTAVGLLSAAAWLPWLVVGLPAGAWVDRLPKRPVMQACDVVSLVVLASVPAAAAVGRLTMPQLLVVALLAGTAKVFFATAYRAFLPELLGGERLVDANARLLATEAAAGVAGPGLGGALTQAVGAANALLADAASFAVSLLCLRRLPSTAPRRTERRRHLRAEIGEGLRFVRHDRLLRTLMLHGGAGNLLLTGFGAIEVAFLVRGLGLGAGTAGALLALAGAGAAAGAAAAPALGRRLGSARALVALKAGGAPFGLLVPLCDTGWRLALFVAGGFLSAAGIAAGNVLSLGFLPHYCPSGLLGRVSTTMQVVNFGAIPVGAALGGVLADALGFRAALWLLLGGFAATGAILLASPLRGRRDLPTATDRRVGASDVDDGSRTGQPAAQTDGVPATASS